MAARNAFAHPQAIDWSLAMPITRAFRPLSSASAAAASGIMTSCSGVHGAYGARSSIPRRSG
jgi:hypothetical protein